MDDEYHKEEAEQKKLGQLLARSREIALTIPRDDLKKLCCENLMCKRCLFESVCWSVKEVLTQGMTQQENEFILDLFEYCPFRNLVDLNVKLGEGKISVNMLETVVGAVDHRANELEKKYGILRKFRLDARGHVL